MRPVIDRHGLPFSFAVETLGNNALFEGYDPAAYAPVEEDDPSPPFVAPREPVLTETRWVEPEPAPPAPVARRPEPVPEPFAREPEPVVLDPMPADATP